MADVHNTLVAGILLAVVVVGVAGLYFTMSASGPEVVYVSGGNTQLSSSSPFAIFSKARITGLDANKIAKDIVAFSLTIDLVGGGTSTGSGSVNQGALLVKFNTCNIGTDIGAEVVFGNGLSVQDLDIANTLDSASCQAAGGTFIGNQGALVELLGTLNQIDCGAFTVPPGDFTGFTVDYTIFNLDTGAGCVGICNNAPFGSPITLDIDSTTAGIPNTASFCDQLETSAPDNGICVCLDITVDASASAEADDCLKAMKNGQTVQVLTEYEAVLPPVFPCV